MLVADSVTITWPWVFTLLIGNGGFQLFAAKVIFKSSVIISLRDSKADLKSIIDELYKPQLDVISTMSEKIEINENRLTFLDGQMLQANELLKLQVTNNHNDTTRALSEVAVSLKAIRDDLKESAKEHEKENRITAISIARLELALELKPYEPKE